MSEKTKNIVMVATQDAGVINVFTQALLDKDYQLLVEESKLNAVWDTLASNIVCLVLDLVKMDGESEAFLNIIKKVRPRLPIVILSPDGRNDVAETLAEIGIFYRTFKPLRFEEIRQLLEGVERLTARRHDFLCVSM